MGLPREFYGKLVDELNKNSNELAAARQMQITLHAYGKLVHKRFADTVSVLVSNELVHMVVNDVAGLAEDWKPALLAKLSETKKHAQHRSDLTKSIKALDAVLKELECMAFGL